MECLIFNHLQIRLKIYNKSVVGGEGGRGRGLPLRTYLTKTVDKSEV